MKKPTYTDAQIIEAGKQLLAEDKPVTPFGIRNLLGGGNHLRIKLVWEAAQQAGLEAETTVASHPEISLENRHIASLKKPQVNPAPEKMPAPVLDPTMQQLQDMDNVIERLAYLSRLLSESRLQLLATFGDESDLFSTFCQDDH
jgi:hypothetical protein